MILLSNLMNAIAAILNLILNLILILLTVSAVLSWLPQARYNQSVMMLNAITDKILRPIRKFIPMRSGIDFAFIVAFIIIIFLQTFVVATLVDYATHIKNNDATNIRIINSAK